jgi:CRISPR-associated endonuclease/helicase Cas3
MMTPAVWPDWLEDVWAKSPTDKSEKGESLARHTWSTLQILASFIKLRPNLPAIVGFPGLWRCLFWGCWLHDFGKVTTGFQSLLRGGPRWPHRHEVISLAFMDWLAGTLTGEEITWVTAAVVSHHRDAKEIMLSYMDPPCHEDDPVTPLVSGIDPKTLEGLWQWLALCSESWLETLQLVNSGIGPLQLPVLDEAVRLIKENGAARVRHWLKIYRRFIRRLRNYDENFLRLGTIALRGQLISSDHMASAHTGLPPELLLNDPDTLIKRLEMKHLYAHQEACASTFGSAILVAPTGSGKTEAALLWASAQGKYGAIPRLFYTLPYQASMNAMYERFQKPFPGKVGLEHSRTVLALYRRLLDEDYTKEDAVRAARWGRSLVRLGYFPVRVLSPYQMFKAVYRLKGYESILSDYYGAAFVLDEVHAYETRRLAMLFGLVKYLRENFAACFFVMSATLPTLLKERLAEALETHKFIYATPETFARFNRHRLYLIEGDLMQSVDKIAANARKNQSVLVCCNTVRRAQAAYFALKNELEKDFEIILLHGRFNARDRLAKEQLVKAATGARSNERKPVVLVATQVVEVSLDIDLDVIYTDPAPLEALIQRFGRVNRRRLKESAPVYVYRQPMDGQGIYDDRLIERALMVLEKQNNRIINEAKISSWLDEVYKGEIAEEWKKEYEKAYTEFWESCLTSLTAFESDDWLEEAFYKAFDSVEVLPEALTEPYESLVQENPLEASQLLVPVRWGQYIQLRNKGRVRPARSKNQPKIVGAGYNDEVGLLLSEKP